MSKPLDTQTRRTAGGRDFLFVNFRDYYEDEQGAELVETLGEGGANFNRPLLVLTRPNISDVGAKTRAAASRMSGQLEKSSAPIAIIVEATVLRFVIKSLIILALSKGPLKVVGTEDEGLGWLEQLLDSGDAG